MIAMCLTACFAETLEIPQHSLRVQSGMQGEAVRLFHEDGKGSDLSRFYVTVGNEQFDIKNYNVRGLPEGTTNEQLKNHYWFKLNQHGENSTLEANGRVRGGKPFWEKRWFKETVKFVEKVIVIAKIIKK